MVLTLRKCSCGSSWCKNCFKKGGLEKIVNRLRLWDWKRVRHIVLTVNRDRTSHEWYRQITSGRFISKMISSIGLREVRLIKDWVWILEFHSDGYPHWHLLIEMGDDKGMIGGQVIRNYWVAGEWVKEDYIKSEKHWGFMLGYLDKHGYFFSEKKGVQSKLPDWALNVLGLKIRKYGFKVKNDGDKNIGIDTVKIKRFSGFVKTMFNNGVKRCNKTYEIILSACGKGTKCCVWGDNISYGFLTDIPYKKSLELFKGKGEYVEGKGYVVVGDENDLIMIELVDEIYRMEKIVVENGLGGIEELKSYNRQGLYI